MTTNKEMIEMKRVKLSNKHYVKKSTASALSRLKNKKRSSLSILI